MEVRMSQKAFFHILILIPKLDLSGPSKGAIALFNGLQSLGVSVELLPLKESNNNVVNANTMLTEERFFYSKVRKFRKYLGCSNFEGRTPILVSLCLQADILALSAGRRVRKLSSVRGNLVANYSDDFGKLGKFLAFVHHQLLKKFTTITALNHQMKSNLLKVNLNTQVIPNFIDEINFPFLDQAPEGNFKYVFVGTLSRRKAVIELIHAFMVCNESHPDTELHIIGDGPLRNEVEKLVVYYRAASIIKVYGFVSDPIPIVKGCDVFVLPSWSEGISRAALEALFVGKRCIMQDVDGNAELILTDTQGMLIQNIDSLAAALKSIRSTGREEDVQRLPQNFRQKYCCKQFIKVFEKYFI